eukprot:m.626094 g.626094  ORF g.626094 m.626094 type:complete len:225 (+) comp22550_c0_seq5:89-763(+)
MVVHSIHCHSLLCTENIVPSPDIQSRHLFFMCVQVDIMQAAPARKECDRQEGWFVDGVLQQLRTSMKEHLRRKLGAGGAVPSKKRRRHAEIRKHTITTSIMGRLTAQQQRQPQHMPMHPITSEATAQEQHSEPNDAMTPSEETADVTKPTTTAPAVAIPHLPTVEPVEDYAARSSGASGVCAQAVPVGAPGGGSVVVGAMLHDDDDSNDDSDDGITGSWDHIFM